MTLQRLETIARESGITRICIKRVDGLWRAQAWNDGIGAHAEKVNESLEIALLSVVTEIDE